MNNNKTTSPSSKPRFSWIPYLIATILLLALIFLWRELSSTRQSLAALVQKHGTLAGELKSTKAELDQVNSGDSSIETRKRLETARSANTAESVKEEIESLFLQEPTVEQKPDGLAVQFGFNPDENIALPSSITLVVRIPGNSSSRIISLKASDGTDVAPIINATGTLGIIEGSPEALGSLSFELTVTAPVKATVRGSEGIIDFELDITPDACTVRKL